MTDLHRLTEKRTVLLSGLFDADYYRTAHPGQRESPADPLTHYIIRGEAEGYRPNPLFLPAYYRRLAMSGITRDRNALAHYAEEGERLGYKPHPAFDPPAYLAANPEFAGFVDRPLFHYLRIGRYAELPVAPGSRGRALAHVLKVQGCAEAVTTSGRRDLRALAAYKQAVVRELGLVDGFAICREVLGWPASCRVVAKPVVPLHQAAAHCAAFYAIRPGPDGFAAPPPHILSDAGAAVSETPDALLIACIVEARVRAGSGLVEKTGAVLIPRNWSDALQHRLAIDPAVLHAAGDTVWLASCDDGADQVELEEGFMLLGSESDDLTPWLRDVLPQCLAAHASGALPRVPVLVDQDLPVRQRQALQLLLPAGIEIVSLPAAATARVRRLWCAAGQLTDAGFRTQSGAASPAAVTAASNQLVQGAEAATIVPTGQDRVYLARRRPIRPPLNAAELEIAATQRGFAIVTMENLSFAEQVRLLRHAELAIALDREDLVLAWFARPGTRLCCIAHPDCAPTPSHVHELAQLGIELTVLSGVAAESRGPERDGFRIDPVAFGDLLARWLGAESRRP